MVPNPLITLVLKERCILRKLQNQRNSDEDPNPTQLKVASVSLV